MPNGTPLELPSDAPLTLLSLGAARLAVSIGDDNEKTLLEAGKPLGLITFLACSPGREVSRARLLDLLWADQVPEAARHALRQTLWHIKRRVPGGVLSATPDTVTLSQPIRSDRDDFLSAVEARDWATAVNLYRGDFFPAFAAPGGADFEQWADLERRRLRQMFAAAAMALAREWLGSGRFRDAQRLARRLREMQPDSEAAWRLLLEAHLAASDFVTARIDAEALEAIAADEGFTPSASTLSLLKQARSSNARGVLQSDADAARATAFEAALVGREAEFARLTAQWESVQHGGAASICLVARAGLGKTRLLRDLSARVRSMRGRVVTIRGTLALRDVPYALVAELASALATLPGARSIAPASARTLVGLNPTLSSYFDVAPTATSGSEELRQRSMALRELILAVTEDHATALLIDDLHWSDVESVQVIRACLAGMGSSRVLSVLAFRPDDRLQAIRAEVCANVIELHALAATDMLPFIESLALLPDEPWSRDFPEALWRSVGGSPLLSIEALQLLMDKHLLDRVDDRWQCSDPLALHQTLSDGATLQTRFTDLPRENRWLLSLAAISGLGLSATEYAEASARTPESVSASLEELERRGFMQREGDGWAISHDEIAAAALEAAGVEGARAAAEAAGTVIARTAGSDERRTRIAAALLVRGAAQVQLSGLFRTFATRAFHRGDRRGLGALARDLLGAAASDADVGALRRAAPLHWQLGLVSRLRLGVAAVALLGTIGMGVTAFANAGGPQQPPDAIVGVVLSDGGGGTIIRQIELRESNWDTKRPLLPSRTLPDLVLHDYSPTSLDGTASPSGRGAIVSLAVDDSGVIDLFRVEPDMPPVRLTSSPGDDNAPALSPDGKWLAFATGRWSAMSRYDIALLEVATGQVRQWTSGDETDSPPVWSPDGSRIAFVRTRWGVAVNQLCLLSLTDSVPSCHDLSIDMGITGWLDASHLLVRADSAGAERLLRYSLRDGTFGMFADDWDAGAVTLSNDGRWVFCMCRREVGEVRRAIVFPAERPNHWRSVDVVGLSSDPRPMWLRWSRDATPHSVSIDSGWRSPKVGVPHKLIAAVRDSLGRVRSGLATRWSLPNGGDATIDSVTGILTVRKAGPVLVEASTGNDASGRLLLSVNNTPAREVLRERWDDLRMTAWYPFGYPAASIDSTRGEGRVLSNNGDGSFTSGVVSRQAFDVRDGLALDLRASVPAPLRQWQTLSAEFISPSDTAALVRARERNAVSFVDLAEHLCGVAFPVENSVSQTNDAVLNLANANGDAQSFVPEGATSGAWVLVRVQLLPDGRCGVAFNGKPLGVLGTPTAPFARARLLLGGKSYKTNVWVGEVRVYRGVPNDIDWSKAPVLR